MKHQNISIPKNLADIQILRSKYLVTKRYKIKNAYNIRYNINPERLFKEFLEEIENEKSEKGMHCSMCSHSLICLRGNLPLIGIDNIKFNEFFLRTAQNWQFKKNYDFLDFIRLSQGQIDIIEKRDAQMLINGSAGSGKSITLLYKMIKVMMDEKNLKEYCI